MSDKTEDANELEVGLDVSETPDVAQGREKIAAAAPEVEPESDDPYVAALLREREGYVTHGKKDRVAAVDAELKRRGHKEKAAPKGRTAPEAKKATAAKKTTSSKD